MLNVFFRKVLKTGEMLNMLNVGPPKSHFLTLIFPQTFNIFNIFNISPVLSTFLEQPFKHIEHI